MLEIKCWIERLIDMSKIELVRSTIVLEGLDIISKDRMSWENWHINGLDNMLKERMICRNSIQHAENFIIISNM